ncbi:MAG: 2,3-bisphosphoglycerate-independent phosphoglycerate mutase [Clostridia bacterium]|nr:2,3-bisphosphoglycerate-independent phosphoglycerate mutase [Clostridia bacterium]
MSKKPTMLMILDGFGISDKKEANAIAMANTPNLDNIFKTYPHTTLKASGLAVGLPEGQMGNSEVGHLNIGAGRIVYQELTKISKEIEEGDFFKNQVLLDAMKTKGALHVFGLLSDGGVHSHIDHMKAVIKMAKENGVKNLYLHAFMDGRDVSPTSGLGFMEEIEEYMNEIGLGKVASVSGRYYAMDRDNRMERLSLAYDAIVLGKGKMADFGVDAVEKAYARGETDEFILPTVTSPEGTILDGDSVVFINFRPDRAREITRALVDDDFNGFHREYRPKDIYYVCMTQYDASMPGVHVAYPPKRIENTLGEYISSLGLKQLRIAETEKYAHVTFFFNGGVEEKYEGEDRILVKSPSVATYDLKPEMSAYEVTDRLIEVLDKYDMIILNYANSDMVGHTGVLDAAVKAVEALDVCVKRVVDKVLSVGGQILLTADHGNSDDMTVTAHSLNPVPLVHISSEPRELKDGGKLSDLAPTMLELMGLEIPKEITGKSLLK